MPVVELSISGNSVQETTEQNDNFLIFEDRKQEIDGVTVSFENGVITLNGTATNGINLDIPIKDLLKTDTYRFTILQESGSRSDNIGFLLRDSNTDENLITINGSGGTTYLLENDTYCYFRIWIPKNNQISNIVYKCMLSKGEEGKTWVEGIPNSPSPEFPSEIECVGDNVNMLNIADIEETESSGVKYSVKNGILKLDGTATAGMQINLASNITIAKGTYTHSCNYIQQGLFISFDNLQANVLNGSNLKKTFTLTEDTTYTKYFLWINQGAILNDVEIKLKLEKDTESSPFSSYNMGCASVVVGDKNVFSFEKAEKLATYAMPSYEVIDNNSIELKNSADWAYIQYQYILKKITQYTISYDLEFEGTENVAQWWTTIEDSLGSIATDFVTLVNNKYIKTFTTREDMIVKIKLFASTPINPALTIIKNIQIEEGNTATEYIPHLEQTKVVDVQKPMLEGDYFVKEKDGWKEVHTWNKQVLDGTQNVTYFDAPSKEIADTLDTAYFQISSVKLGEGEQDKTFKNNIKSNYFKNLYTGDEIWGNVSTDNSYLKESIALQVWTRLRIKKERLEGYTNDLTNTEKVTLLNNYLQQQYNSGNPIYLCYKLATPTKLTCTEKQAQQLDDLLNTSTYKNVTHIYSTDKVSPIIKIKYRKDIETMFNQAYKNLI